MNEQGMPDDISDDHPAKEMAELAKVMPNAPVAPAHGIAAIALSMAMKYHDINMVKDGQLYQQYKLEGRNFQPLHIDVVFETAIQIERHLLASSDRIAGLIIDALEVKLEDEPEGEAQPEAVQTGAPAAL